jgi:hypothetical protein
VFNADEGLPQLLVLRTLSTLMMGEEFTMMSSSDLQGRLLKHAGASAYLHVMTWPRAPGTSRGAGAGAGAGAAALAASVC